jgi:hypothetical protein
MELQGIISEINCAQELFAGEKDDEFGGMDITALFLVPFPYPIN